MNNISFGVCAIKKLKKTVDKLLEFWYIIGEVCIFNKGASKISVRVQFVLSDEEYDELKKLVAKKGVSISKFVKDCLPLNRSDEDSFERIWSEFSEKLNSFPAGIEFDVSIIMTQQRWKLFDRSTKLSLAKLFNKKVTTGELDNIELVGRSPTNVSIYKKKF